MEQELVATVAYPLRALLARLGLSPLKGPSSHASLVAFAMTSYITAA